MSYISQIARFGRGAPSVGSGREPLSNAQLQMIAPSIFAQTKHESRSERFAYIPTYQVLDAMRNEGFVPVKAAQGNSRIEGKANFTKHLVRFRRADDIGNAKLGQSYREVVLVNAHDGTSSYRLMAGVFRLVCLNGMVVRERDEGELVVPHKGDVIGKVIEGSYEVLNQSAKAIEAAETWADVQLSQDEQLAYAESAHDLRFDEGSMQAEAIQPRQLLQARRREDQGNSLWLTFQRVQEASIRGGLSGYTRPEDRRQARQVTTRAVNNIDGDVRLNRALWALTERMAQLKGVAA